MLKKLLSLMLCAVLCVAAWPARAETPAFAMLGEVLCDSMTRGLDTYGVEAPDWVVSEDGLSRAMAMDSCKYTVIQDEAGRVIRLVTEWQHPNTLAGLSTLQEEYQAYGMMSVLLGCALLAWEEDFTMTMTETFGEEFEQLFSSRKDRFNAAVKAPVAIEGTICGRPARFDIVHEDHMYYVTFTYSQKEGAEETVAAAPAGINTTGAFIAAKSDIQHYMIGWMAEQDGTMYAWNDAPDGTSSSMTTNNGVEMTIFLDGAGRVTSLQSVARMTLDTFDARIISAVEASSGLAAGALIREPTGESVTRVTKKANDGVYDVYLPLLVEENQYETKKAFYGCLFTCGLTYEMEEADELDDAVIVFTFRLYAPGVLPQ